MILEGGFYVNTPIDDLETLPLSYIYSKMTFGSLSNKNQSFIDICLWDRLTNASSIVSAMIDTGAVFGAINPSFINNKSNVVGSYSYETLDGDKKTKDLFETYISIPSFADNIKWIFKYIEAPITISGIIIGTEFLNNFRYCYNSPEKGKFLLENIISK